MGMTDFTGIAQSRSACVKPLSAKRFPALGTILRLLLSHTEIDAGPPQKPPQSSHCFRAIGWSALSGTGPAVIRRLPSASGGTAASLARRGRATPAILLGIPGRGRETGPVARFSGDWTG
jgi:hypothetical protein